MTLADLLKHAARVTGAVHSFELLLDTGDGVDLKEVKAVEFREGAIILRADL